ncbi:hypothetical protein L0F63_005845, partial [Massospora cicadina]
HNPPTMFTIPQPKQIKANSNPNLVSPTQHHSQWVNSRYPYLTSTFHPSRPSNDILNHNSQVQLPYNQRCDQRHLSRKFDRAYHLSAVSARDHHYGYQFDDMGFPLISNQASVDPFQSFVYHNMHTDVQSFDPMNAVTNGSGRRRSGSELSNVLPVVMTGSRPYSPSVAHSVFVIKGSPLCSKQKLRVPSHLLLTSEQRISMEDLSVMKRVFDSDDASNSRLFLSQNGLLPEQLTQPLNKWKTRNTRKRKYATTHLYQCCCGSDVKQFHGTKGTRRSKQKYPFVGCLAFVEVARRTDDGSLIWARGLMDHSKACQKAIPFVAQD